MQEFLQDDITLTLFKEVVEDGIEQTPEEEVGITLPFSPSDIKIETKNITIGHVITRLEHNEINLFTEFQRLPNLWDVTKKSQLIESVLLNLPIPSFYFDGKDDDTWQVVDGLQRISTIKHFIFGNKQENGEIEKLALTGLEFLRQFEGKTYDELSRSLQRRIEYFPITAYVIQSGTPEKAKYILFKRINTAGLILKPQEIRHTLNQGIASDYVKQLAKLLSFKQATDFTIKSERMEDRDFVNRFLAFYLLSLDEYESDLDAFLHKTMSDINKRTNVYTEAKREEIKNVFSQTMRTAYSIFGNDAFRKRLNNEDRRRPLNKALFDSISVNIANLSEEQREILTQKAAILKDKLKRVSREDARFWTAISTATGQKSNVIYRFAVIQRLLRETLNHNNDT